MSAPLISVLDQNLPAPATAALAAAILKSKPPDENVGEYIDKINNCLRSPRTGQAETQSYAFDAATYWKSEYQRVLSQKHDAEDEVMRLRDELEALKLTSTKHGKHTQTGKPAAKANTQTKRQVPQHTAGSQDLVGPADVVEPNGDPDIDPLLRQLRMLYKQNDSTGAATRDPAVRLSIACAHLNKLMSRPEDLAPRIDTICRCLYTSLGRHANIDNEKQLCSRMVRVFETALADLHQSAVNEVERKDTEASSKKKRHKPNIRATKSNAGADETRACVRRESLVKIMKCMILKLEVNQSAHLRLFEGLTSVLIDHIGSTLSFLVFADPQNADTGLCPPIGILDACDLDPDPAFATAVAELNATHLIALLRCVLSKMHGGTQKQTSATEAASKSPSTGKNGQARLSQHFEETLQNALLVGVFGREDGEFQESLWRAEEVSDLAEEDVCESGPLETKSEWFIAQLWELLGWDILASKLSIATMKDD